MIGSASSDDAGVYRIDSERALVQTIDFFTPIVDDAYLYGQIAAANSLSDVYAMGGLPLTAMAVLALPDEVSLELANTILRGGADKAIDARCTMIGGHSVKNPEPLYGLSVTGMVHPDRIISNAGGRPGDRLILTKPLGTGIATTAVKRGIAPADLVDLAIEAMATLNSVGHPLASRDLVRGGTDITGFGLLGHLISLCRSSNVRAEIAYESLPVLGPAVWDLIKAGCIPGGSRQNWITAQSDVDPGTATEQACLLLADAQTSGGLLLCVAEEHFNEVMQTLVQHRSLCATEIGTLQPLEPDSPASLVRLI